MGDNKKPRKPTKAERKKLADFLLQEGSLDKTNRDMIDSAYIAVFDDYITSYPGFFGKIIMVCWDSGPASYELYTIADGKVRFEEQHEDMRRDHRL